MRNIFLAFLSTVLISCSNEGAKELSSSALTLCSDKNNQEICDLTHDGALCNISRVETIRHVVIHNRQKSVANAYTALKMLDKYRACLENAVLAQSDIQKSDEVSRFFTIANIPNFQDKIVQQTKGIRPEINLWLYKKTGYARHWDSMVNGASMAKHVHHDVYTVMMAEAATRDMDEAKKIADLLLTQTELLSELTPEVFEFYVMFHLRKGNDFKSAVWHGLYSEYVKESAGINTQYFKSHGNMPESKLQDAQELADSIIFKAAWMGLRVKDLEKLII